MRIANLTAELEAITRDFEYGIVPGSATIFMIDEEEGIGRLDLTLLEGVMVVIEVGDQGFKVTSYSPLYSGATAMTITQTIVSQLNRPFETMENLLMTISPMFAQRFHELLYQKLQTVYESSSTTPGKDALTATAAGAGTETGTTTLPIFPQDHVHADNGSKTNSSLHHSPDNPTSFDNNNSRAH